MRIIREVILYVPKVLISDYKAIAVNEFRTVLVKDGQSSKPETTAIEK